MEIGLVISPPSDSDLPPVQTSVEPHPCTDHLPTHYHCGPLPFSLPSASPLPPQPPALSPAPSPPAEPSEEGLGGGRPSSVPQQRVCLSLQLRTPSSPSGTRVHVARTGGLSELPRGGIWIPLWHPKAKSPASLPPCCLCLSPARARAPAECSRVPAQTPEPSAPCLLATCVLQQARPCLPASRTACPPPQGRTSPCGEHYTEPRETAQPCRWWSLHSDRRETEVMAFRYCRIGTHQRKITGGERAVIAVLGRWTVLATKRYSIQRRSLVDTKYQNNLGPSPVCVPRGLSFLFFSQHRVYWSWCFQKRELALVFLV